MPATSDRPDPAVTDPTVTDPTVTPAVDSSRRCAAIVVAGGSGRRYGGFKQFDRLQGRRVLDFSLAAARTACDPVILVVPESLAGHTESAADLVVVGGSTRSASVRAGLAAVPADRDVVVVHDAVRPLAGPDLFARVIAAVRAGADAAIPGVAVVDTVRRRDGQPLGVERDDLVAVQTPQAFAAAVLRRVHDDPRAEATDDATLVSAVGGTVVVVPGERANMKITEPADLVVAEALAASSGLPDAMADALTMPGPPPDATVATGAGRQEQQP